jgi:multidrug efflux pump subunit AcrB
MLEGKQAVSLDVSRQSGTNTVQLIDAVKRRLKEIERTLPRG